MRFGAALSGLPVQHAAAPMRNRLMSSRWWWLAAVLLGLAVLVQWTQAAPASQAPAVLPAGNDAIQHFLQAQRIASSAATPAALRSADAAEWRSVKLPDLWPDDEQHAKAGAGWYRVVFTARAPLQDHALHIRVLAPGALYAVNGRVLSVTPDALSRSGSAEAVFVPIPQDALREGDNELLLRLSVLPDRAAYVGSFHLGPVADIRAEHQTFMFFKETLRQMIVVTALLLAIVLGSIWWARRAEVLYLLFALVCVGWAHQTHNYYATQPPWPEPAWGISIAIGDYLTESLMCLFVLRYIGRLRRWHVVTLGVYVAISAALTLINGLSDARWWWAWYSQPWEFTPFVISALYMLLLVQHAWRTRSAIDGLMAAATVTMIWASWWDLSPLTPDLQVGESVSLLPYAYGVVVAVFSARLVRRFIDSIGEVEALNRDLEGRIAERTQEIRVSLEALAVAERERHAMEERARLMSEMHDGIGTHLMVSMRSLESGKLDPLQAAEVLRMCLEELRLTIDSMDDHGNDLAALLGMVRYRLGDRLRWAGLDLRWEVGDTPPLPALGHDGALHAMRIVQECINNILKHSQASCIRVCTAVDGVRQAVVLRVIDDGRGFAPSAIDPLHGHGLANMRRRASKLGGTLSVTSRPGETVIELLLPLPASP
jgi:signal transduction histidine kinase